MRKLPIEHLMHTICVVHLGS